MDGLRTKAPEAFARIHPYVPGKPLEEVAREYGITDAVKLASNENPLGPSPRAAAAIRDALSRLHRYPEGAAPLLTEKLSAHLGVRPDHIVLGNGSDEVISLLTRVFLGPGDEAILPEPAFLMYDIMINCDGATPVPVPLRDYAIDLTAILDRITPRTRMIFLTSPNNPTGLALSRSSFEPFLDAVPGDVVVVMDEAYIEFARDPGAVNGIHHINRGRPVAVLRTFSKAYGLAGLRIGYGVMPPEMAELLNRIRPPFNTSIPAQLGAAAALDDAAFLGQTLRTVHNGLDRIGAALTDLGLDFLLSQANFLFVRVPMAADTLFEGLLREGVVVRSLTSYGYPNHVRITAGTTAENEKCIAALKKVLG
jgi:histidinol-phosphate aminotransferase